MLLLSLGLLLIAALVGSLLAASHLRAEHVRTGWLLGTLHAALGVTGFIVLLFALRGPPRGVAAGAAAFGEIAAAMLAITLVAGLAILVLRLRHWRVMGLYIGIHATIAVCGIVILAAYTLLG
jgi:hypothetical protein